MRNADRRSLRGRLLTSLQTSLIFASLAAGAPAEEAASETPAVETDCPATAEVQPLGNLQLTAHPPLDALACVTSPSLGQPPEELTFCWLSVAEAASQQTCATTTQQDPAASSFAVGLSQAGGRRFLEPGAELPKVDPWFIRFAPVQGGRGREEAVLRIEPKQRPADGRNYVIRGTRLSFEDSRYKVTIHSGVAYLHSRESFADAFPDIYASVESRFMEKNLGCRGQKGLRPGKDELRRLCEDPSSPPLNFLLRGYLRGGLTSTSKVDDPKLAEPTSLGEGAKSFEATGGFGTGFSWAVRAGGIEDTRRFSALAVLRFGVLSLQEPTTRGDTLPFQWLAGLRLENEDGHFQGAFAELGVGGSDQFAAKRSPRLKFEGLIPFSDPKTLGFAMRITIDRPWPWTKLESADSRAGDIKLSFLLRIDVRKLFDAIGGPGQEP